MGVAGGTCSMACECERRCKLSPGHTDEHSCLDADCEEAQDE